MLKPQEADGQSRRDAEKAEQSSPSNMIPKKSRIPRELFTELLSGARFVHSEHFTMRFRIVQNGPSRVGVSVSKKISKSAVVRNSVRRRVYDSVYPLLVTLSGCLFLFVAKSGAQNLKGEKLKSEMQALLSEARQIVLEGKKSYNP